jgi:ribosome-associated protein
VPPSKSHPSTEKIIPEIPESELVFETARAGGPGGQNVNKVETKVRLVFDFWKSRVLSWKEKSILAREPDILHSCNPEGHIVITSQRHRSQGLNRAAAVEKLMKLIRAALKPKAVRIKTRTPRASKHARLLGKTFRSQTKTLRRKPRNGAQE